MIQKVPQLEHCLLVTTIFALRHSTLVVARLEQSVHMVLLTEMGAQVWDTL